MLPLMVMPFQRKQER